MEEQCDLRHDRRCSINSWLLLLTFGPILVLKGAVWWWARSNFIGLNETRVEHIWRDFYKVWSIISKLGVWCDWWTFCSCPLAALTSRQQSWTAWRCVCVCGGGREGVVFVLEHPYQLLLVLVGMFCGWILLQCSLARCQHDLQRSESLSHIT